MLARVVTWEGGSAEGIRAAAAQLKANVAQGPPPGVTSNGITMLADPQRGRVLMIGIFETESDLHDSEPALEAMSPPEGMGTRAAVEVYDVIADVRMKEAPPLG
jgi:hypothetical protein